MSSRSPRIFSDHTSLDDADSSRRDMSSAGNSGDGSTRFEAVRTSPDESSAGRILVVDDNESNRDMLSRRLRRRGYVVEVAEDGRRALEMVQTSPFDLILLDIMMPELNGYAVLERLKSDEELRHVPVLMISAVDDIESVVRCIELGADDYLPKPFNPILLRARVEASLSRKYLHDRERLYAQSLERELEIGRQIQQSFLPATLPQPPGWEIAVRFRPARQVAGDFYDAYELPAGRIGLVIADVCGKGVGAALFMALFRSLLRAYAERAGNSPSSPGVAILTEAMTATNRYITYVHKSAHMFASVFFGVLDPKSGMLHYVNAGHLPPVVSRVDGTTERLLPTAPAIGLLPASRFPVDQVRLEPGDLLVAFTDGVTEARDVKRDFFSEERLLRLIDGTYSSASSVLDAIDREVESYSADTSAFDDLTLLAVRHVGA